MEKEREMAMLPAKNDGEIVVHQIDEGVIDCCILGRSPLIFNRVSEKAKRQLLMPKGKKTAADKASSLKHNPMAEYRASVYRTLNDAAPTRLVFPSGAFKGAMATAALDLPGTKKTEIGRLVSVDGWNISMFGTPQLLMSIVRSADMNRTPDVRTRAILPEWACRVSIRFVKPRLRDQAIINLIAAAGFTAGVGDFRQEKGKGSFGLFNIVSHDNPDFLRVTQTQTRAEQDAALNDPACFDAETEELLTWFDAEVIKLTGKKIAA